MLRLLFRLVTVAIIAVVAFGAYLLVPAGSMPGRVDALVVLAGGGGERLALAERLAREGRAPVLAISHGLGWAPSLCRARDVPGTSVAVLCFWPSPDTTKGEMIAVGELALRRSWRSVTLVTSSYHVRRAVLVARRCIGSRVRVSSAAAPPAWARSGTWAAALREEGAMIRALTIDREC